MTVTLAEAVRYNCFNSSYYVLTTARLAALAFESVQAYPPQYPPALCRALISAKYCCDLLRPDTICVDIRHATAELAMLACLHDQPRSPIPML
jgi:hypothetical protein